MCKIWENVEPSGPSTTGRQVWKTGERGENIPQHQASQRIPFPLCVRVFIYIHVSRRRRREGSITGGVPAMGRTKGWRVNARVFCSRFAGTPVPSSPLPSSMVHRPSPRPIANSRYSLDVPTPFPSRANPSVAAAAAAERQRSTHAPQPGWRTRKRVDGGAAVSRLPAATRCRATVAGVNGVLFDYHPTTAAARYRFENFSVLLSQRRRRRRMLCHVRPFKIDNSVFRVFAKIKTKQVVTTQFTNTHTFVERLNDTTMIIYTQSDIYRYHGFVPTSFRFSCITGGYVCRTWNVFPARYFVSLYLSWDNV